MGLWAAAAALPILIHLLNRRQYREEPWAAMEYLLRAMKKNSRRIRIEQMLLLVIRALILILAALAWMDLIYNSGAAGPSGSGGNTHTVLLIDGSYSMAARQGDATRFEQAKELAAEVVDAADRGDAFTLVLMAEPPQIIIGQPAFDPQDVKQEIADLQMPHGGASLSASLASVDKLLQDVREKHRRIDSQRVCILSDLGATTWNDVTSDEIDNRIRRIAEAAPTTLFDVGADGVENAAVTSFALRDAYVVAGHDVVFQAQIRNFGPGDRSNERVQLIVNDRPASEKSLDIAAGDEAAIAFTHRFDAPGEHVVQVRLPEDQLGIDNHRYLSVPVRPALRVLCISGKPGAADHVAIALSPTRSVEASIRTEVASESALLERDLAEYDCVVLCNVSRFGRSEAAVLGDYARHGGGLVFFLGDQVSADSYNRWLTGGDEVADEDAESVQLLPATLGDAVSISQYRFDPRRYDHPIVDAFRGHERTGLLTTPVWKYVKLNVDEDSPSKVALWFDSGDPAIVEHTVGRGRVIMVATSASDASLDVSTNPPTPWTVLSTWPSFPPLVQEMLSAATSGRFENRNVAVGQPISSSVNSTAVGIPLTIAPPDQPEQRVRLQLDGEVSSWTFAATDTSGIYRAEFGEPIDKTELYTANIDARESNLTRISSDDLPAMWQRELEAAPEEVSAAALAGPGRRIYPWLLGAVLALLLFETYIAWHVGNRSL